MNKLAVKFNKEKQKYEQLVVEYQQENMFMFPQQIQSQQPPQQPPQQKRQPVSEPVYTENSSGTYVEQDQQVQVQDVQPQQRKTSGWTPEKRAAAAERLRLGRLKKGLK